MAIGCRFVRFLLCGFRLSAGWDLAGRFVLLIVLPQQRGNRFQQFVNVDRLEQHWYAQLSWRGRWPPEWHIRSTTPPAFADLSDARTQSRRSRSPVSPARGRTAADRSHCRQLLAGLFGRYRRAHLVPALLQNQPIGDQYVRLVIDYQNVTLAFHRHRSILMHGRQFDGEHGSLDLTGCERAVCRHGSQ